MIKDAAGKEVVIGDRVAYVQRATWKFDSVL